MNILEFINRKNQIIKNHCGVELIPSHLVTEVQSFPLNLSRDHFACPYCMNFYKQKCVGCPMFENGNDCHLPTSTYSQMCEAGGDVDLVSPKALWHQELKTLIEEWNQSLETI